MIKKLIPALFLVALISPYPALSSQNLVINEIMVKPAQGQNEWIEIYNLSNSEINLEGYWLDDDDTLMVAGEVQKGTADPGSDPKALSGIISAGQFYVITFSSYLNDAGDVPTLFFLQGNSELKLDSYSYTENPGENSTFARYPDGVGPWQKCSPTQQAPNSGCQAIEQTSPTQSEESATDNNEQLSTSAKVSSPSPSPKFSPLLKSSPNSKTNNQVLGESKENEQFQNLSSPSPQAMPTPNPESQGSKVKIAAILTGSGAMLVGVALALYYLKFRKHKKENNPTQF